jgi:hypothetical protein
MGRTRKPDEPTIQPGVKVIWGKHERRVVAIDGAGENAMCWLKSSTGYYSSVKLSRLVRAD